MHGLNTTIYFTGLTIKGNMEHNVRHGTFAKVSADSSQKEEELYQYG